MTERGRCLASSSFSFEPSRRLIATKAAERRRLRSRSLQQLQRSSSSQALAARFALDSNAVFCAACGLPRHHKHPLLRAICHADFGLRPASPTPGTRCRKVEASRALAGIRAATNRCSALATSRLSLPQPSHRVVLSNRSNARAPLALRSSLIQFQLQPFSLSCRVEHSPSVVGSH